MSLQFKKKLRVLTPLIIFLFPIVVRAASTYLENPLGIDNLPDLIGRVLKYLIGFLGILALLMFLYGGFTWMTAMGEPKKVTKGAETIKWAAIGLIVIFLSYALVYSIFNFIGGAVS